LCSKQAGGFATLSTSSPGNTLRERLSPEHHSHIQNLQSAMLANLGIPDVPAWKSVQRYAPEANSIAVQQSMKFVGAIMVFLFVFFMIFVGEI